MKIGNDKVLAKASIKTNEAAGVPAGTKKRQGGAQPAEQVEISVRKAEVQKLKKLAAALPDYRHDNLAALKQQVSQGTYHVDAGRIAEKMLHLL